MDPLSLTVATATLLDMSIRASGSILAYVDQVRNPDKCLGYLRVEIESLSSLLKSFHTTLSDPMSQYWMYHSGTGHPDGEYWEHVRLSISYCKETIQSLENILGKDWGRKGLLSRMIRPARLSLRAEEITMYRQQVVSYREAIGLAFQWISVSEHFSRCCAVLRFRSASMRNEEMTIQHTAKLEQMLRNISNILNGLQCRRQSASTESAKVVFDNLESCILTAQSLVSAASTTYSGSIAPSQLPTGSVRILTHDRRADIENWSSSIPSGRGAIPTIPEDKEEPIHPGASDVLSSHGPDADTGVTALTREYSSDSTNCWRTNVMIRHWLEEGKTKFSEKSYQIAEDSLRRAYTESVKMWGLLFQGWQQLSKMLVISHCKQGHWDEAEKVLQNIAHSTSSHEEERLVFELIDMLVGRYCEQGNISNALIFVTNSIHIRMTSDQAVLGFNWIQAKLYFRNGEFTKSQELCLKIIQALENPVGFDLEIFRESIILMVLVCMEKGDHVEAGGMKALLPSNYQSYLMIDELCCKSPAGAITDLLNVHSEHLIPPTNLEEWKIRATQISQDPSFSSQQRPFILQTIVNYGTPDHLLRLLKKWNYDEELDYTWSNGGTVLIEVSMRGREEMVSLLCEYGASVNISTSDGCTALHGAAYCNHLGVVEILLERKADVTMRNEKGLTALGFARMRGNKAIVKILEGRRPSGSSKGYFSRESSFSGSLEEKGQARRRLSLFSR